MDTDRNLLFGVLALQADLIDNDTFARACALWSAQKDRPLGDLLLDGGLITAGEKADVERLLERKLRKHRGDVRASLAEAAGEGARASLSGVGDADIAHALEGLATVVDPSQAADRYRLERLHATGGIGRVWLATDPDLGREVALKELRPERAANPALVARFLREARVTGRLEHPGVVPVYELARRPRGRPPYYTMRFVRGRTLTDAAKGYHDLRAAGRAGPLELRELLGAVVAVCNVVAYAHAHRVLHRDLKGQNVLLGPYGEVVLLDWGLAKLADEPSAKGPGEDTASLPPFGATTGPFGETEHGQVLGTPGYMAPEQAAARADLVGPRTDVYGLGAILYEVLTGRPPFSGPDTEEVLRQVREEGPERPGRHAPGTPPALEAVCLKALARDPAGRYASAEDLARDLRFFLADEPVSAWPEPWATRVGRWVRRRRSLAGAAALLLVGLLAAAAVVTVLSGRANRRAEAAREEADANYRLARGAVEQFLTGVSEGPLLDRPGMQPLRRELLRSALEYYHEFTARHADDPSLQGDLAGAYRRLGEITAEVGPRADAKAALRKAAGLYEGPRRAGQDDEALRAELARCYQSLAYLEIYSNEQAAGEASAAAAAALLARLRAERPGEVDYGRRLGRCHDLTGNGRIMTGRYAEAEAAHREALRIHGETVARFSRDAEARRLLALAHNNHSESQRFLGDVRGREGSLRAAVGLYRELLAEEPESPRLLKELARSLTNLGHMDAEWGRWAAAERPLEEAYDLLQKLVADNRSVIEFRELLAEAGGDLGEVRAARGETAEALELLGEAAEVNERLIGPNPDETDQLHNLAGWYYELGRLLGDLGRPVAGAAECAKALACQRRVLAVSPGAGHCRARLLQIRQQLALLRAEADPADAAAGAAEQAEVVAGWAGLAAAADPRKVEWRVGLGVARLRLAELRLKTGAAVPAAADLAAAAADLAAACATRPDYLEARRRLAETYEAQARLPGVPRGEALASAERAVGLADGLAEEDGAYAFDLACALGVYAAVLRGAGDEAEAREQEDEAVRSLGAAVAAGYENWHKLRTDPRLAGLRGRKDFRELFP